MKYLGKKELNKIISVLQDVRDTSTMTHCRFNKSDDFGNSTISEDDEKYTEEIKKATRIWRESWITNPLTEIIEKLSGVVMNQ